MKISRDCCLKYDTNCFWMLQINLLSLYYRNAYYAKQKNGIIQNISQLSDICSNKLSNCNDINIVDIN